MTVGEARQTYGAQLKAYNMQSYSLEKKRAELNEKIKRTPDGATIYANEAATLELTYNAVKEKQDEYQNYMDQLMVQWNAKMNEISSKQSTDAVKKGMNEMAKVMKVARRMMRGDIVPASDEKKLMEYDDKLYQMAKQAQMLAQMREKERKKYDSLWGDEETPENVDAMEASDSQEAFADGPEVVSVEDTMASVLSNID